MKLTVTQPVEIEAKHICVNIPADDDQDSLPYPGKSWDFTIDIDTGKILGWSGGAFAVHSKVVDQGTYVLTGEQGNILAALDQDYVPCCIPGEYGDYMEFNIEPDGKITEWAKFGTPDRVMKSFFPAKD